MYPEKMSSLPDALFKNLMASLEVGLVKYPFGPLEGTNLCLQKRDAFESPKIVEAQGPVARRMVSASYWF